MRPAFGELPLRKRFVQPGGLVFAQPRMQDQVGTARHHMDGVDLQQAHARDRFHHVGAPRTAARRAQQSLRRQLQALRLRKRQMQSFRRRCRRR